MNRLDQLDSWYADWSALKVVVLGLGVSGFSAADTLVELGAHVRVLASDADADREAILAVLGVEVHRLVNAEVPATLVDFAPDLIVVSPGFRPHHPIVQWAQAQNIPLWGDIELAWRVRDKVSADAKWLLITGTNGKTTTTQLTAAILSEAGLRVAPCGNIGVPVLDAVRDPAGFDVFVVEISSFQLHYSAIDGPGALRPWASVCLNLAEDHLDWHGGMPEYARAKAKVYANTEFACIYNRADVSTLTMVEEAEVQEGARAISFGLDSPGRSELGIVEGILVDRAFLAERATIALELTTLEELARVRLDTPHVVANILAAAALARSVEVSPEIVHAALMGFQLDAHRIALVARSGEVDWIDDSKATNAHAAHASLSAYASVVWIVGGLLKGVDIEPLIKKHRERLRAAVVIGHDRGAVLGALAHHAPDVPVIEVSETEGFAVMQAAVAAAKDLARPGDTVLLAPSAASMDQFVDYADRGEQFARAVRELVEGARG